MTTFIRQPDRGLQTRARSTAAAVGLAVATVLSAASTLAHGNLGTVNLITRPDGATIPEYPKDGRRWVIGNPGQEYGIRVCNSTGGRLLAVMSVDGVNVITGDTASPAQSGYVLDAYQCADI